MNRFVAVLMVPAAALALVGSPATAATTVVLDTDTTIDAGHSFLDAAVEIRDGLDGPTTVTLVDGGVLHQGGVVSESSQLIMQGGDIDFFVTVEDSAKLTIVGGSVGCRMDECLLIDYDSLVGATGGGEIHIRGGDINDSLQLRDTSAAHFYGTNLLAEDAGGGSLYVSGRFANNELFSIRVGGASLPGTSVVLHTIPEPSTWMLAALAVVSMAAGRRRRPRATA